MMVARMVSLLLPIVALEKPRCTNVSEWGPVSCDNVEKEDTDADVDANADTNADANADAAINANANLNATNDYTNANSNANNCGNANADTISR